MDGRSEEDEDGTSCPEGNCNPPPALPCEVVSETSGSSTDAESLSPVQSPVLDQVSGARAAYSLRRLRSDYSGPAIRVRRSSDDATKDIGFTQKGWLDARAVENFVGSGDGFVVKWYAQVSGTPDLVQKNADQQPYIVRDGTVETDPKGQYTLYFDSGRRYMEASGFSSAIPLNDYTFWGVVQPTEIDGETEVFGIGTSDNKHWQGTFYRYVQSYINKDDVRFGDQAGSINLSDFNMITMRNNGTRADIWQGNTRHASTTGDDGLGDDHARPVVSVGGGFTGTLSEFVVYPSVPDKTLYTFYKSVATDWDVGPAEWNRDALLPQQYPYQVTLYDWIEQLSVEDVTLPDSSMTWDLSGLGRDELADLWLEAESLTASSVTRAAPEWYLLDAGNGKGIEATGTVKVWHEPEGSGDYGGNPPRSWANEPAFLYQFDLPTSDGTQGNPYYQNPAVARRALVVAMVDLMMHHKNWATESSGWYDMFGKAALSWAETYRWTRDVLPPDVQEAFETGMGYALDRMIAIGPRGVNTNMDMFAVQAQADFAMATDDPVLQCKAVRAARRALFGDKDAELEGDQHEVFAAGGRDGGVFDPSGFIMEGGQPDVFYGGESIYHLAGALAAVTDRETGDVPPEWTFLEEVVRRLQAWRTYQMFYDPGVSSPAVGGTKKRRVITAGAGFSGRTSYGVPAGQANEPWKNMLIAHRFPNHAFKGWAPDPSEMKDEIRSRLQYMNGELSETYSQAPSEWGGWSPWAKKTAYLPVEGWYSDLRQMKTSGNPKYEKPPVARSGITYNKAFGGEPVGEEYWAYKTSNGSNTWGFFLEAQAEQGGYGGWYGGKIETFWTKATGVVLINRHGKTGCDGGSEDSVCWDNLDKKAGHHVWGRDDNGKGFTTLLLRGRDLKRTSTFDLEGSPPTVTVNNVFNDPNIPKDSSRSGEQNGSVLEGEFEVENTFEARANGLKVTHTITSDQSDEVTELWASLPVYLRHRNPKRQGDQLQANMEDTSIEYRTDGGWKALPEDQDGDGTPELVATSALRLGRDYNRERGMRYAYVDFEGEQKVRLSEGPYYDPYQSMTSARTVHIDLHGRPGTTQTLPAKTTLSYTLQPDAPTTN